MDLMTTAGVFIKSEPETIPEEENLTSPCDTTFQYGIVKQETEDVSAINCEPETLVAEVHAQGSGAYSEIDFDYADTKKECFFHVEGINQSRGKLLSFTSKYACVHIYY